MMSIRSLADFNRSSLGGDGDWLTPPPSPPRPQTPGRHDERGIRTINWPPARTSTWPYTRTFSRPRTVTTNTVTPPAGMPNHGTSEYLRSVSSGPIRENAPELPPCAIALANTATVSIDCPAAGFAQ